ncbi:S41 family peptidase [Pedobacter miscanthi]|jgi:C-terminal processing protease CtpA/Prc|uniref:S41 family peptidase n=1 Tax=Pedobacter miscanthi TaxID=2259170 RepID=UPI00292D0749|nr:S41 family peptidase [Pedobacter miscanthi]
MIKNFTVILSLLLVAIITLPACSQHKPSAAENINFLTVVVKTNLKNYFDQNKADELIEKVTEMERKKLFEGVSEEVAAKMITDMLRKETHDKHFNIIAYTIKPQAEAKQTQPQNQQPFTAGITSIKILKNNIGYIKWDACIAGEAAFKKIRSALDSVAGCKQIIFDITENPGGDGASSAFINQFFYESKDYQTLLVKKCTGEANWHQSEVIFNYSQGPKLFNTPLYIITSDKTFSAAEYFAFTAKEMKRATILGKTTAGAGNPGNAMSTYLQNSDTVFWMFTPNCQITTRAGHSLEGVGVKPDVELTSNNWVNETVDYILKQN